MLHDGNDITIIATGLLVYEALQAALELESHGIDARVINMPTIKPLDYDLVTTAARETGCIITAEEHSIVGGLGDAVCATTSYACPVPVHKIGVNDCFGHSDPAEELLREFGLTAENIVSVALAAKQSV